MPAKASRTETRIRCCTKIMRGTREKWWRKLIETSIHYPVKAKKAFQKAASALGEHPEFRGLPYLACFALSARAAAPHQHPARPSPAPRRRRGRGRRTDALVPA